MSFFVTGTDTGVGKTYTLVQLLRLLRAAGKSCAGYKPICCGDRSDAEFLLAAGSDGFRIDEINPCWLKTPAAPLVAAQIERATIDIDGIVKRFRELEDRVDVVLIEGVGGWLVPILENYSISNLATDLKQPVLVVAENRLGCLNHTALTVGSVEQAGLRCAGIVLNSPSDVQDLAVTTNPDILRLIVKPPVLPGLTEKTAQLTSEWRRLFDIGEE